MVVVGRAFSGRRRLPGFGVISRWMLDRCLLGCWAVREDMSAWNGGDGRGGVVAWLGLVQLVPR